MSSKSIFLDWTCSNRFLILRITLILVKTDKNIILKLLRIYISTLPPLLLSILTWRFMLGSSSPLNLGGFPASRFPELFVLNFLLLKAPENIFNIQQKIYAQKTLYADHYTFPVVEGKVSTPAAVRAHKKEVYFSRKLMSCCECSRRWK